MKAKLKLKWKDESWTNSKGTIFNARVGDFLLNVCKHYYHDWSSWGATIRFYNDQFTEQYHFDSSYKAKVWAEKEVITRINRILKDLGK